MAITRPQVDMLAKLLDVADLRHRVLANNVANVNTPEYRQLDVSFEDAFAQALNRGSIQQATRLNPLLVEGLGGATRVDGNNVDIDMEMSRLTKNTLLYRTFAQLLATELSTMRTAISGRQT